jgi:tRNA G18 (ribose-2'-O)-methylase SpoU
MEAMSMQKSLPKCYLLLHNIAKPKNIGTIVRSACAFGLEKIFLVSKDPEKKKNSKIMKGFGVRHGAQGTEDRIDYEFFFSVKEAKEYFSQRKVKIVGVEIGNDARSLYDPNAFEGDTVLILGNEGDGMHPSLKEICDYFVYIPQYTNKTASLNVAIAGSIVFSQFARFANYPEMPVFGEKFRSEEQDELDKKARIEAQIQHIGKRERRKDDEGSSEEQCVDEGAGEDTLDENTLAEKAD